MPSDTLLPSLNAGTAQMDTEFMHMVDELTRRGFLGGLGGAAVIGLAACGASSTTSASDTTATRATRRISTIHGEITVPADPKRIVFADFPEGCTLLDLGLTPVGRTSYMPDFPAYAKALKGVRIIDESSGDLIMEAIAALKPDLIVTADWADSAKRTMPYSTLEAIAPTAVFTWEQAAGNWRDQAAATADAVNKTATLNTIKQKYLSRAATIRKTYTNLFSRTRWDLIDGSSQGVWDLYSAASSHGGVLAEAGVQLAAAKSQTSGYKQYSFERLDLLADTDVILTTAASLPYLKKQGTFTSLPAVKAGNVYTTDLFFPASYGIALALLDDLGSVCRRLG